jgi:heme-degrading monooxygenase HmoA
MVEELIMTLNKTAQSFLKVMVLLCAVAAICLAVTYRSGLAEGTVARGEERAGCPRAADRDVGAPADGAPALPQTKKVVARMWHGRVLSSKADEYYAYLKEAGIDKIEAIAGNLGAQVLRRTDGKTTEFTVISYWQSRDAITKFAGEDIEKTHFLAKDPQYLLDLEPKVKHFDVLYDGRK